MSVEGLRLTLEDGTMEAVVDHGDGNLFTVAMCDELSRWLLAPPAGAHVLRLRAVGDAFCLGRERAAVGAAALRAETEALIRLNRAIAGSDLITVAEVQGDAAGYGVGLAAICDISVAAPSARFWFPEVEMDLAPSIVLVWLAPTIGRKQALLLTATGEAIDARRAAELDLITEVAASDDRLAAAVSEHVAVLRSHSPTVHADIKRFVTRTAGWTADEAYELAAEKLTNAGLARQLGASEQRRG
ncbi:MAG TPA: enoyl-CoA hydratase/isomerase family protein [Thermoleophilaceae bacterium]|nr:enoyl-CoA hydratase/isomerase family protein [Thermoleophilaceae bacterium]